MKKPVETKRLALTAAIFYATALAIQCLIAVCAPLLYQGGSVGLSDLLGTALLILMRLHCIPIAVLAFWFSRQTEIRYAHLRLTAIAAPICYFGGGLCSFVVSRLVFYMMGMQTYSQFNRTIFYMNLVGFCYAVGFILLSCAVAIEYFLYQHAPSDGETS